MHLPCMAVPAWFLSKSGFCDGECLGPTPRQWPAGGLKSRLVLTWTNGVLATCYFVILARPSCTFSLSSLFCKSWMTSNHPTFKWSSCWSLKEKIAGNPSVIFLRIWLPQSDAPTRCNRDCLAKAHLVIFCKSRPNSDYGLGQPAGTLRPLCPLHNLIRAWTRLD